MPKLSAMMTVCNEANRYLRRCLNSLTRYTDEIIILDDASTDETPDICLTYPGVRLYRQKTGLFSVDESLLRRRLWNCAGENDPEWILALDADEFLEEASLHEIPYLLKQNEWNAVGFRLFDCWDSEDCFRIDGFWNPWRRGFSTCLIRYDPRLDSSWPDLKYHCGRIPLAYRFLPAYECDLRIKHLGWVDARDREAKINRSAERDPAFEYLSRQHYESILYPPEKILLQKWEEHIPFSSIYYK